MAAAAARLVLGVRMPLPPVPRPRGAPEEGTDGSLPEIHGLDHQQQEEEEPVGAVVLVRSLVVVDEKQERPVARMPEVWKGVVPYSVAVAAGGPTTAHTMITVLSIFIAISLAE